jgi:hypothetical protein
VEQASPKIGSRVCIVTYSHSYSDPAHHDICCLAQSDWNVVIRIDMDILWEYGSRDSSVGIALGHGLDDRCSRVRFPTGAGNFSLHHRVQNGSGAHPASCPMGTRGSFPGVKRPEREADHSLPSSAEVKEWAELYRHSPIGLHGSVLS